HGQATDARQPRTGRGDRDEDPRKGQGNAKRLIELVSIGRLFLGGFPARSISLPDFFCVKVGGDLRKGWVESCRKDGWRAAERVGGELQKELDGALRKGLKTKKGSE